jgi:hypothetical protein
MATFTITGDDTLTLWDRVFNDFSDNDVSTVVYNEDLVMDSVGKNQNTIFAKNEKGNAATLTMRLIRCSSDDRFMERKLAAMNRNFPATLSASGEFVKRIGDGNGNVYRDVTQLQGGMISRRSDSKDNVSGDTEQGTVIYIMRFASAVRSIQ